VNNQDDTITFDPSVFTTPQIISITSGQMMIQSDGPVGSQHLLTITGPGADKLTIDANYHSRIFYIGDTGAAVIEGLTLTKGNGTINGGAPEENSAGGAILVESGGPGPENLVLRRSVVSENRSMLNLAGAGGIQVFGRVRIIDSAIINNQALNFGAGIFSYGQVTLVNSTISGNSAPTSAGICLFNGELYLTNSVVAFNHATSGGNGGIYLATGQSGQAHLHPRNSIIANNTSSTDYGKDINGIVLSLGNNIIGSNYGAKIFPSDDPTNQLNVDPKLDASLSYNGSPIPTHALRADSTAIDQGSNCVLTSTAAGGCSDDPVVTDLRGVSRPQDGDGDNVATVDIGPFEATRSEVLNAPNAPDLHSENDTGTSNTDNITSNSVLTFDMSGLTSGAMVELFRDQQSIATGTASGSSLTLTDGNLTANGLHFYYVKQTVNGTSGLLGKSLSVVFDNIAPSVTLNQASAQTDPTRNQPIQFDISFNEPVVGFSSADITLAGSTAGVSSASVSVTGTGPYVASVSNISSDGVVTAGVTAGAVQDLAGNSSSASTSTDNNVTFDTTPPSVTINQAVSQADPTRFLNINFTVVFSEPVTGFTNADISLVGSTANVASAAKTVTGSGTTYNVAIGNITSNGGTVVASIPGLAAQDAAGNLSLASSSTDNTVTLDNVSPTVTINQAASQPDPTNALPINYTVVFSEPVTGFDSADVQLTSSTFNTSGATVNVTGSGTTYNVAIANITTNGNILRATVRSAAATDGAGNTSITSSSTDNSVTFDNIAPTVSINQAIGQIDPASTQPINFTVAFSESVTGFGPTDVSLAGSTANMSFASINVSGSGNVYTVSINNVRSSGQVVASLPAGAAFDLRGNASLASTSTDNTVTVSVRPVAFDFDGDGKTDISIFRPGPGEWWYSRSSDGVVRAGQFGAATDIPTPGDFTGDGKTDIAFWRPSDGFWYVLRSEDGSFFSFPFGSNGDIPMPADFDADGKTDPAIFRPSTGTWFIPQSGGGGTLIGAFGQAGDQPVAADYDGDGKADVAIIRRNAGNMEWWIQRSTAGLFASVFGVESDKAVAGDYTGDGKTDVAVWRPSNGNWFVMRSEDFSFFSFPFGQNLDIPAPGDYDGDGKFDATVFRPSTATWFVNRTSGAGPLIAGFGIASDTPVPSVLVR